MATETDYRKFLRNNYAESAALFGSYDDQDKYFVDSQIKQELVNIHKLITVYKQDYMLCEARVFGTVIYFKVVFYLGEMESEKFANLYLLEKFKDLNKDVELETFLVNFKSSNDPAFLDKLKEALNLYTPSELADGKQINSKSEVLEQLIRKKQDISKMMILSMGVDNRKYCNDILKILKNSKSYSNLEKILKKKIKGIKAEKNTAKYFALLKEVLDIIIEENYDEIDEETLNWIKQTNQNYILTYMNKKKEVQKPKVKAETMVAGPKKSAGKKAGGGGGDEKKSKPKANSAGTVGSLPKYDNKPLDIPYIDRYGRPDYMPGGRRGGPHHHRRPPKEAMDSLSGEYFNTFFDSIGKTLNDNIFNPLDKSLADLTSKIMTNNHIPGGKYSNLKETVSGLDVFSKNSTLKNTVDSSFNNENNLLKINNASKDLDGGKDFTL